MTNPTHTFASPYLQLQATADESTVVAHMPSGLEKALVTATTNPVTGGVELSAGGSAFKAYTPGFDPLPTALEHSGVGSSWLWKHSSTTLGLAASWWAFVPVSTDGYYASFGLGTFNVAGCIPHLGRMHLGLIGSFKHHSAGSGVTKTGAWTTSTVDYAPAGSASYSVTAGDQISFAVTGHTLVMRSVGMANGGYAVVSIDGSWTAANRLPVFTSADYGSGLCRASDVGKCYVNTGTNGLAWPDLHTPLAEGLADSAHTVVFEATNTKPTYSSATRAYIGGVVGCSAADVGQNLTSGARVIAFVETVHDFRGNGASAMVYTPSVEKATPGTYEFLGEVHGAETLESIVVEVDGVDRSAAAADAYYGGTVINIRVVSTVASTDATGTPVLRKNNNHTFSTTGACPAVTAMRHTWLVAKRVGSAYPLMLPIGVSRSAGGAPALENTRWDKLYIGDYSSIPSDLTTNGNAQHGNVRTTLAVATSSQHTRKAYATLLDGGRCLDFFAHSGPDNAFVIDRSDGMDKVYFSRSSLTNIERFAVGDTVDGAIGFGIVKI